MNPEPSRTLNNFSDILDERRHTSDFLWISQSWSPNPECNLKKRSIGQIKKDVVGSERVQHVIKQLCEETNQSRVLLEQKVWDIMDEMAHKKQLPIIRWFGLFLTKVMKKLYSEVKINEDSLNKVRETMKHHPVLFLPSHRSYADFLLMSYVCFHYKVELPIIAAGMDFVHMWGIGRLLRGSGAFFIRRSFGHDKLYWALFTEYVQTHVLHKEAPVEFFIEGTRSRSAKSLLPKLGFLTAVLELYFTGKLPDLMIVPVNISYDRTLEETLYAYELLGVPKPKESTSGLLKALQVLDEKYGKVHIDFTEPISVRQYFGDIIDRSAHAMLPLHVTNFSQNETLACEDLAYFIVQQQQKYAVISTFTLISVILTHNLISGDAPLSLNELVREISWFRSVLETLGALVDLREGEEEAGTLESISVHKNLVQLTSSNQLHLVRVHSPSTTLVNSKAFRGHCLSHETMEVAIPMIMLQHYVNQSLHLLIRPAILTVAMQHLENCGEVDKDELFKKYNFLCSVMSHEFIFPRKGVELEFEETLKQLDLLNILEVISSKRVAVGNHKKLQNMLYEIIQPFIAGYKVVCQVVQEVAVSPCKGAEILQTSQKEVEKLVACGSLVHPYSMTLEVLTAGLNSLVSLQGVTKTKIDNEMMYQVNHERAEELKQEFEKLLVWCGKRPDQHQVTSKQLFVLGGRAKL